MKVIIQITVLIHLLFLTGTVCGQTLGGRYSFAFATLPSSARITALGGTLIATTDTDVNLGMTNPASLVGVESGSMSFNHNFHFAGISTGHAAYGQKISKLGITSQIAVSYANYGEFVAADETGQQQGSFTGREALVTIGAGKQINERISLGANLKWATTAFESYGANGVLMDVGMSYLTGEGRTRIAATITNFGTQLKTLNGTRYATPLDVQIGISNKLKHLPLRLSVIMHNLHRYNIRYDDPNNVNDTDFFGNQETTSGFKAEVDNFFRHMIFNGEFLLGKSQNFNLRVGYNHLRRRELSLSQYRSQAGFSVGFGLKISKFKLDYGVGYHHLVGGTNHLSISTNLSEFRSKI